MTRGNNNWKQTTMNDSSLSQVSIPVHVARISFPFEGVTVKLPFSITVYHVVTQPIIHSLCLSTRPPYFYNACRYIYYCWLTYQLYVPPSIPLCHVLPYLCGGKKKGDLIMCFASGGNWFYSKVTLMRVNKKEYCNLIISAAHLFPFHHLPTPQFQ